MAEEQHVHVDETVLIKFAQRLAGNEKRTRDAAVKKLRKWMTYRSTGKFGKMSQSQHLQMRYDIIPSACLRVSRDMQRSFVYASKVMVHHRLFRNIGIHNRYTFNET